MAKTRKKTTSNSANRWTELEKRIVPVDELPNFLKIGIYGRSGTGKTTLLGTAPKPLLVLDIREEGTKSIRKVPESKVFRVKGWDDIEDIYWYLESNPGKYKSVGIDGVTTLQDMAKIKVAGPKVGTIVSRRVWADAADLMKPWILTYRDLPMNVFFIAQDRITEGEDLDDEESLSPEIGPYVMPSVAKILNGAVDIMGNTFIREVQKKVKSKSGKIKTEDVTEYCLRVGPHSRYVTKFRVDISEGIKVLPPPVIVNPTFDKLREYVK